MKSQYINALVLSAPLNPTASFLSLMSSSTVDARYHSSTTFEASEHDVDRYIEAKKLGIFCEIRDHPYQDVNTENLVQRILRSKPLYEERQRLKLEKQKYEGNSPHTASITEHVSEGTFQGPHDGTVG